MENLTEIKVAILGGGIHGVGVAHDLISRGLDDIHLFEKDDIASGTSSRSTKLIHGGLRYLEHIRDFPLVYEALHERKKLLELAPDLVKPLRLILPVLKRGGKPGWMLDIGLSLYDLLAGKDKIHPHKKLEISDMQNSFSNIDPNIFTHGFEFYDTQTDDYLLTRRVALSSEKLGTKIHRKTIVSKIIPQNNYWVLEGKDSQGEIFHYKTKIIVNALGPWSHELYKQSGFEPKHDAVNNKGVHLLFENKENLKCGFFFQSPEDHRIFFLLPWQNMILLGTTETDFHEHPDKQHPDDHDEKYLLEHLNRYVKNKYEKKDILGKFSGLRWLLSKKGESLSSLTRKPLVTEHHLGNDSVIYTIYGGKLTTYRLLSKNIGDKIALRMHLNFMSKTHLKDFWLPPSYENLEKEIVLKRFG